MRTILIKFIILFLGILLQHESDFDFIVILLTFLLAVSFTFICQYYENKKLTSILSGIYLSVSLIFPIAAWFIPVLYLDLIKYYSLKKLILVPILIFLVTLHPPLILILILVLITSYLLNEVNILSYKNKQINDYNNLQKSKLTIKNNELLSRKNDEIHMEKLKERNRIARDIHDNIGHLLSRALLQIGALQSINKSETLREPLNDLKETLTNSMNEIRNSIHNLKDDSIDLKLTVLELLKNSPLETSLRYDISSNIDNKIKNFFLVTLKEALTNTLKHSNATAFNVTLDEHPILYQLLITDNGTTSYSNTTGIGLINIRERVEELDGYCHIENKEGFKIFITIPKEKNNENHNNR